MKMNPSRRKSNNIYLIENIDPKIPRYDVSLAFVIIAKNSKEARRLIIEDIQKGISWYQDEGKERWLDSKRSSCKLIGWTTLSPSVLLSSTLSG